ncbi:hypothetical protein FQA39_LY01364 [Lamprigera yunnana]|nr:hypothetical protein FQA39_LY01364 [Lamprigera yunnana]
MPTLFRKRTKIDEGVKNWVITGYPVYYFMKDRKPVFEILSGFTCPSRYCPDITIYPLDICVSMEHP